MSLFDRIAAAARPAGLAIHGESVTYDPLDVTPTVLTAIRGARSQFESEATASFERIWAPVGAFPVAPQRGHKVILRGTRYIVHSWKPDVDSSGDGITVYLAKEGYA